MRQIVLDTETTGLNHKEGDRIIEIGCVELVNRCFTKNNFHCYINPERDSDESALAIHGLSSIFLKKKPKFKYIVSDFLKYIRNTEVIIHNSYFDIGFINSELTRLKLPNFTEFCPKIIDTLSHAKKIFPGKKNSLDALCNRFKIDLSKRKLHGALLDATLLAEVYLSLTRNQGNLFGNDIALNQSFDDCCVSLLPDLNRFDLKVIYANKYEEDLHDYILSNIKKY